MRSQIAFILSLVFVLTLAASFGQDNKPKKTTEKDLGRKQRSLLEDAVHRGVSRCRKLDGQDLVQVIVNPSLALDSPSYIITAEFANGDVGIFQGGIDDTEDQLVVVDKRYLIQLDEVVRRGMGK